MDIDSAVTYCLSKRGAWDDLPFGEDALVFKVGPKIFAIISMKKKPLGINLKCDPDLALELRDMFEDVRPGYHMNKLHWNTVVLAGSIPDKEIENMIDHSYDLVFRGLDKKEKKAI